MKTIIKYIALVKWGVSRDPKTACERRCLVKTVMEENGAVLYKDGDRESIWFIPKGLDRGVEEVEWFDFRKNRAIFGLVFRYAEREDRHVGQLKKITANLRRAQLTGDHIEKPLEVILGEFRNAVEKWMSAGVARETRGLGRHEGKILTFMRQG